MSELDKSCHVISHKEGGGGPMGWIQPVCSCGWEGRREYAYEDYQHTNVREQAVSHLRKFTEQEARHAN